MEDYNIIHLMAPFKPFVSDTAVTDIFVNRPREIYVRYTNGITKQFEDRKVDSNFLHDFVSYFARINDQDFDEALTPSVSCKIAGGHRLEAIAGANVPDTGFSMAIRLHRNIIFDYKDYGFDPKIIQRIQELIAHKKNILVSGATGSGKTSLLNCMIKDIPQTERLISIEGVRELKIPHLNKVCYAYSENASACASLKANNLLVRTMRMRPDRILLGEILDANAYTFFKALNTGHSGTFATIHANNPTEALSAIADYIRMNGDNNIGDQGIHSLKASLRKNIHAVIQLHEYKGAVTGYMEEFLEEDEGPNSGRIIYAH
jgi:type IV secretion system protein VirB11